MGLGSGWSVGLGGDGGMGVMVMVVVVVVVCCQRVLLLAGMRVDVRI